LASCVDFLRRATYGFLVEETKTPTIRAAVAAWVNLEPKIPLERVAAETGRSISTVRRWVTEGEAEFEPRLSDALVMEKLKPGLFKLLQSKPKPQKRTTSKRK
jgi:hypothetical protein